MRHALLGEEVGVSRRDDALTGKQAGVSVIRVDSVAPPRVMAEDHVGSQLADPAGDLSSFAQAGVELSVGPSEKDDLAA